MNLSSSKPTLGAGETLTITCFTCGMPSSKEWAQKIRSRLPNSLRPYYPFLLQLQTPHGAVLKEDGSTFVCAFCHASLEAQWKNYERLPTPIPPMNRKYNLYKFICAVCGVETYRKRVRTLPYQEFPFLANQRAPGSLTLGNNPLAVVCLDCSETLWAQSAEYDRWGLPVHKRHFNWMARPPPPEDSVEATVARLPSGETQLPRCPPIEPILITKQKEAPTLVYEPVASSKIRSRSSKSESKTGNDTNVSVRKTSLSSSTSNPNLDATSAGVHSQPPVVTVAPMSAHSTTLSLRKETLSVPPNVSSYPKYDCGLQPIFPRSPIFSPASYSHFHWAGRESSLNDHYSYASLDGLQQTSANASWSWLPPPPSSNLVPYQPFMPTTFSNRSYGLNEPYYNASHSYYPPSPETNLSSVSTNASSPYLPTFTLQNSGSSPTTYASQMSSTPNCTDNSSVHQRQSSSVSSNEPEVHVRKSSSDGKSSSSRTTSSSQDCTPRKLNHVKVSSTKNLSGSRGTIPKKSFSKVESSTSGTIMKDAHFKSTTNVCGSEALPINFKPKSNAIRKHNKERLMNSGQWKSSKNSNNISENKYTKSTTSTEFEPVDFSIVSKDRKLKLEKEGGIHSDAVMDLSLSSSSSLKTCTNSATPTRNVPSSSTNFMIAYLCKSESSSTIPHNSPHSSETDNPEFAIDLKTRPDVRESSGRRSVIVTLPKAENLSDGLTENDSTFQVPLNSSNTTDDNSAPSSDSVEVTTKTATNESMICDENLTENDSKEDSSPQEVPQMVRHEIVPDETVISPADSSKEDIEMDVMPDSSGMMPEESPKNVHHLENAQEYVRKIISDHKLETKIAKIRKRKLDEDQEIFLSALGLVTPRKKSEVELDILIRRCQHHTLPPLKLRPSTPPKVQLTKEFEKKILQIAFDDPSTRQTDLNQDEVSFLAQLDLKPASTLERSRRESEWRYILAERMMREKRGKDLVRGDKKPWDLMDIQGGSSKLLTPTKTPTENSEVFGSLSLTLPSDSQIEESVTGSTGSSDLLTYANHNQSMKINKTESITVSAMCIVQPVISYPKYIPSYAASVPSINSCASISTSTEDTIPESSIVTISGPTSSPSNEVSSNLLIAVDDDDVSSQKTQNKETDQTDDTSKSILPSEDARILKVPVINSTDLTVGTNHDHSATNNVLSPSHYKIDPCTMIKTEPSEVNSQTSIISSIIQADVINFGHFENEINNLLNGIPTSPKTDMVCHWPGSLSDWKKLKKHLKSRQSKVKAIEENLKKREKQILKQLRACTKNTQ